MGNFFNSEYIKLRLNNGFDQLNIMYLEILWMDHQWCCQIYLVSKAQYFAVCYNRIFEWF